MHFSGEKTRQLTLSGKNQALFFTAAAGIAFALEIAEGGRIEFIDGERHMFEHFAGIVGGGRNTFLFGDGVFRAVDEILRGTFDADDGEEAERDGEHLTVILVGNSAVQTVANDFGEIFRMEVAVVADLAYVKDTGIENEGIHDLENGGGQIVAGSFRMVASAEIRVQNVAFEDIDITFAAVKNDLLFDHGDAVGLLGSAHTSADLYGDLDIHGNADLVKAAVEGHVVNVDVRAEDLRAFGADRRSALQQFVSDIGKVYRDVFKAVFITAAVENAIGIDINGIAAAAVRRISDIRHKALSFLS